MSTPVKLIIGIGSLSGIAGGAYFLSQNLSKETISQKLEKNKYQVLDKDSAAWTNIFTQYQLVSAEADNKFKFNDATIISKEQLQNQCKEVLAKTDTEKSIYDKAAKWCTVPKTLKEVLRDKNYVSLSVDKNNDDLNQKEWNEKIKLHNKKDQNTDKRFSKLGGNSDEDVKEDKDGRNKIKEACENLEGKKHYEKGFESDLDKSVFWCTKTK